MAKSASSRSSPRTRWSSVSKMLLMSLPKPSALLHLCCKNHSVMFLPNSTHRSPPQPATFTGHYNAEQWDEGLRAFMPNSNVQIYYSVEEVFDNDHRVVSQRGTSTKGKFTFSAADSGEHRICFSPIGAATHSGWLPGGQQVGSIRFDLDLAIGETSKIESDDKDKIQSLQEKVRDLNARLQDIRREQVFQRVRHLECSNYYTGVVLTVSK